MNFSDVLAKERDEYLACLIRSLAEQRKSFPQATTEVLIEINTKNIPLPYRLIRADIIYNTDDGPKLIEVNKEKYFAFDPCEIPIHPNLKAIAHPFHWTGIEFRVFGEILSWDPLTAWINNSIDVTDARYEEGKELLEVVHNVTKPEKCSDHWLLSIDMGSAELNAFDELFIAFAQSGAKRIELGSFSMINT